MSRASRSFAPWDSSRCQWAPLYRLPQRQVHAPSRGYLRPRFPFLIGIHRAFAVQACPGENAVMHSPCVYVRVHAFATHTCAPAKSCACQLSTQHPRQSVGARAPEKACLNLPYGVTREAKFAVPRWARAGQRDMSQPMAARSLQDTCGSTTTRQKQHHAAPFALLEASLCSSWRRKSDPESV